MNKIILVMSTALLLLSCSERKEIKHESELENFMNDIAEAYVKLVLEAGQYDPDFIDAYYGPPEWKPSGDSLKINSDTFNKLNSAADSLLDQLEDLSSFKATDLEALRYKFLYKQLLAVKAKIFMINGGQFSFDQESKALYDVLPAEQSEEFFQQVIDELDDILPGSGNISERLNDLKKNFIIPPEKLQEVFNAAINECRLRTAEHINLPAGEKFELEFISNQPWGAYNWYKGNLRSVIQVNTDLPIYIDEAVGIAAHEGYPGHHLFNILLEDTFVKKKGWMEFIVYPLFSPQSLISEGTAIYGEDILFTPEERIKFVKDVLLPLAGIEVEDKDTELYFQAEELRERLNYAGVTAARNYLDSTWSRNQTLKWLEKYQLRTRESAEKFVSFMEKYRSYVINYPAGKDIVKNYIEKNGGSYKNLNRSWELFELLISLPQTPSGIRD